MSQNNNNNNGPVPGPNSPTNTKPDDSNLTEEILKKGGKGKDEVEKMGKIDRADEVVEESFDAKFRTANSPVHRAVWDKTPIELFRANDVTGAAPTYFQAMDQCVAIVVRHRLAGTLFGDDQKVTATVMQELAEAGYWGMLIDKKYGGQGVTITHFMQFLTRMAAEGDPTVAGMASIHGCIGAVDPMCAYGTEAQKDYFLPRLASGKAISAFALTEPGAGSDLTALKTTAVLDGDSYVVNGRKLFISNILPGRTIGLVCLIDGKPAVLIVELPEVENEHFKLDRYGIHAVKHIHNYGMVFNNLRVPAKNLLVPPVGDGLTIAYHGLNRGRVALCANAGGTMRVLLKSMLPWAEYRETYGDKIGNRELVRWRVARVASLIVGADALVDWCSSLLDEGYRGELECIVAKIFGSESLKETAVDWALKTHGGRAFLQGHLIGDNIHDFIAPCIYEGEGQMLAMAFFKSLVKEPGKKYMGPLANMNDKFPAVLVDGIRFLPAITRMGLWLAGLQLKRGDRRRVAGMDKNLARHFAFGLKQFKSLGRQIAAAMIKYKFKLADRQMRMNELSMDVQRVVTMLAVCMHAHKKGDAVTTLAADILCQDLKREIIGGRKDDAYYMACSKLAKMVVAGNFKQLDGVAESTILRQYKEPVQK
ncbi:MAG TPA: acyl-CoA dehydrogenase family protein [Candidatus Obscuribacter sp.]|nr:acyl-CoA dehydrogenase family protein [Candidatus Obscuribacter sp.]